ncbi:radical SAM family heme chaperone HemW [Nocardioidaceae bacterium]|nr:radical SAM family heme chaperone HemW [Nocardioidaceae bacterium]
MLSPSQLPDGEPVPTDGSLPDASASRVGDRPFGVYVHVPFCSVRCGYCDFNTYTAEELGPVDGPPGASRGSYATAALAEVRLAADVLDGSARPASTVFVGGGTPTLLDPADLVAVLGGVRDHLGLEADAEVTTEANPDSVTPASLAALRAGGFTRISFGMQSAEPHVLAVLDRTHDPANVPRAVAWARGAGFEQVSLDLIYGTPGETVGGWRHTLHTALASEPDHVSAYALIVEDGTALARRVARGEVPAPVDDEQAEKYEVADEELTAAGLGWYEVSNWARDEAARCRHNLAYWRSDDWWGVGPGAHSHVAGTRWWNVKHPTAYAGRLAQGVSPAYAREVLTEDDVYAERLLLEGRIRDGLPISALREGARPRVAALVADGLLDGRAALGRGTVDGQPRLVLTRRGRLLADAVVRDLLD